MIQFNKATKRQSKLRLALIGPAGSGKTYTALTLAQSLGARVALIDTEHGSASKYADRFQFDTLELDTFSPSKYIEAIHAAEEAGYDVLIIDSLSHAWAGRDGALEMVDKIARKSPSGNKFAAWGDVTPLQNQMVDTILGARLHIIATMRSKTEYVLETNDRGKQQPRKIGIGPVQRDGVDYEFDVVGELDADNNLIVTKTRCEALTGQVITKPGLALAEVLKGWLSDGAPVYDRKARGRYLIELRAQQKALGATLAPLTAEQVQAASNEDLERWIHTAEESVMDLKASKG